MASGNRIVYGQSPSSVWMVIEGQNRLQRLGVAHEKLYRFYCVNWQKEWKWGFGQLNGKLLKFATDRLSEQWIVLSYAGSGFGGSSHRFWPWGGILLRARELMWDYHVTTRGPSKTTNLACSRAGKGRRLGACDIAVGRWIWEQMIWQLSRG